MTYDWSTATIRERLAKRFGVAESQANSAADPTAALVAHARAAAFAEALADATYRLDDKDAWRARAAEHTAEVTKLTPGLV